MGSNTIMILAGVGFLIVLLAVILSVHSTWSLWWQTVVNGAPVNPFRVALMRMRRLDPALILAAKIRAANSGVKIRTYKLEGIALANAEVNLIVDAKVKAAQAGVYLHGLAGDLAAEASSQEAMIAGDMNLYLGEAFREIKG